MRGWWRWTVGSVMVASAVWSTAVNAQAAPRGGGGSGSDVCSLATSEEFQRAEGVDPRIGLIPDTPEATQMVWGWHCDYSPGSITVFTKSSELDRVLTMSKAEKRRDPVPGLGQRAFFTVVYPDDKYRRAGLLAVFVGPRIVALTMDAHEGKPADETKPKLESLAKLVLTRLK
jgi:hypothetical protein